MCTFCHQGSIFNKMKFIIVVFITTQLNAHIAVDLMAHTTGTRVGITAYHPGVILVNYLGYPGTMGYFSDFIMVDKLTVRFQN